MNECDYAKMVVVSRVRRVGRRAEKKLFRSKIEIIIRLAYCYVVWQMPEDLRANVPCSNVTYYGGKLLKPNLFSKKKIFCTSIHELQWSSAKNIWKA